VSRYRITNDLITLVQCQSVNPFEAAPRTGHRENEVAVLYGEMMRNVGLEVSLREVAPGRSNVWGLRNRNLSNVATTTKRPTIMLAGHLDTVGAENYLEPFNARIEHGRLHGRGSCDMKAALAAYLEVVRVLSEAKVALSGDLLLVGTCDEENAMLGSQDMRTQGPTADVAIIGEPTDLDVCPTHRGQVCLVITTFGKAVHSSRPKLGRNAIIDMAAVIEQLDKYAYELKIGPSHPLCGTGTTNPGVISGGSIASTVPDVCRLEIDRRTLPGETYEQVVAELHRLLQPLVTTDPGFRYELSSPTLLAEPLDTSLDHPLVHAITEAASDVLKKPMNPRAFAAATDAPNFGIPSVICGPGSLADAHTLHESVSLDEVVAAAKIYLRTILQLNAM
jgi:acetylornithine deacetylase/succinyl-diaminopimelate desuccinylase family protein